MARKRLLLLSNSTNYGAGYLEHALDWIKDFLGRELRSVLFIPFAGVRASHDEYAAKVRARFDEMGYKLDSIHAMGDPIVAIEKAQAIAVGGGNTFQLLHSMYETAILDAIRARVERGVPYIGWSAGSNVACPSIKTTNDMPIVEPESFTALNLVPFQINPHYTDARLEGHGGETRPERLAEFIEVNPDIYVVGLREGSALKIEREQITLLGTPSAAIFIKDKEPAEHDPGKSLQFLLGSRQT